MCDVWIKVNVKSVDLDVSFKRAAMMVAKGDCDSFRVITMRMMVM